MYIYKAIETRKENLKKIVQSIIKHQNEFFLNDKEFVPLTLNEVAFDCDISQSTVSRITTNKYLEYNNKVYNLKEFFPSGVNTKTGKITKEKILDLLYSIIEKENKSNPYSDKEIYNLLSEQGKERLCICKV